MDIYIIVKRERYKTVDGRAVPCYTHGLAMSHNRKTVYVTINDYYW